MDKFWTLLKESVLVQGLITLGAVGTMLYLIIVSREIPSELWAVVTLVLGFYFGAKSQAQINKK